MPQQNWKASDFEGLTPGIDPRRSDKFFVLAGRNYVFDSNGPKSDFGSTWLSGYPAGKPDHSQGFRIKLKDRETDRCFHMYGDGIYEWVESLGGWQPLYYTPDLTIQPHAWSRAYLNDKLFMLHPTAGIIVYDTTNGRCYPHPNPPCKQPIALCENNGRLCVMDANFFYWSGQSNGFDWSPRLGGPGFQKISDRVSGRPIMLTSYTGGTLLWTSGGVMRSEFVGDDMVFRHRALNTELRPINSFCTCKIDEDSVLIVDERGLFISKGETPQAFSPLFNEFLIEFIQENNLALGQNIRIEWDELKRRVYLSISFSFDSPLYEFAFVLYPSLDKWGQFSEPHYAILPSKIASGSRSDDYYGYIGDDGRINIWNDGRSRQVAYTNPSLNAAYPTIQKSTFTTSTCQVVASSATGNSLTSDSTSGVAGYFPWDGGQSATPQVGGLDSYVRMGLLSFDLGAADDQMTEVIQIDVACKTIGGDDYAGFSLVDPLVQVTDMGINDANYYNFNLQMIGSNDGVSASQIAVPKLVRVEKGIRYYSCSEVGVYHMLKISADDPDQFYHLKAFKLTAAYAGRLL